MTVTLLLLLTAFIVTILSWLGKAPLALAVVLIIIALLLPILGV